MIDRLYDDIDDLEDELEAAAVEAFYNEEQQENNADDAAPETMEQLEQQAPK